MEPAPRQRCLNLALHWGLRFQPSRRDGRQAWLARLALKGQPTLRYRYAVKKCSTPDSLPHPREGNQTFNLLGLFSSPTLREGQDF